MTVIRYTGEPVITNDHICSLESRLALSRELLMKEIFCISAVQDGSHWSHVAIEPLKWLVRLRNYYFKFYLILIKIATCGSWLLD